MAFSLRHSDGFADGRDGGSTKAIESFKCQPVLFYGACPSFLGLLGLHLVSSLAIPQRDSDSRKRHAWNVTP